MAPGDAALPRALQTAKRRSTLAELKSILRSEHWILLWLICLCATGLSESSASGSGGVVVDGLRCEYRTHPIGLDILRPRLSWILNANGRGFRQAAFQVLAASSADALKADRGDLWDSGKVASDATVHVEYAGAPLRSRMVVHWKVRVWDQNDRPSEWSSPAFWTMGLLERTAWRARWIADGASVTNLAPNRPHNGFHSVLTNSAQATQWVTIDLGRTRTFEAVRLFPARPYDWQPDRPGFLFPVRFRIESASREDFADRRVLVDRTSADEPNPGTNAVTVAFASSGARYVRLIVTRLGHRDGDHYAFALAELEVLEGGNNVAEGAPVAALDAIESGAWSTRNLTDGVRQTVRPVEAGALPATWLRKTFEVSKTIRRATAYVTALGLYELRINGERVGSQLLSPEWTSYRHRVQVQVCDVTTQLRVGENVMAAVLGEGWYAGRLMAMPRFAYGTHPRFLLQLELEFADGERQTVVTDETWRGTTEGPIRAAGIYDGETYDARREMPGWDSPGFNARDWHPVRHFDLGSEQFVWQRNEPIEVTQELTPIRITEPKPGVWVFDLGQNLVGWCRVRAEGKAGQTVTIRHAEMLQEDGTLYTANLRGAPQVDRYTPREDGGFTFEPRFTYHGFRFVELTGLAQPPATNAVVARVFHSTSPAVGEFACSDASLNQLMRNIVWTQRGNLMSTPNDCPQRDERFGWMGDYQVFAQTACFNMDMAAFFTKSVQDMRDDQAEDGRFPDFAPHPGNGEEARRGPSGSMGFWGAPAWADAGTVVPWRAWQNYADARLLAEHFEAARCWVDYVHAHNPDLVWARNRHNDYNDWLNGNWIKQSDWPTSGASVSNVVLATAFFAHSTELVANMATVLGRMSEAEQYGRLANRIKATFRARFVKPDGRIEGDTQGGYALALNFDLLPETQRPAAVRHLVDNIGLYQNHLSTGIQTTHRAMLELSRHGQHDLAWQLLTNRTFPSWLYMVDNGATTVWERWDGYVKGRGFQDAGMNSFNHWAFGAVGEWMWRNIIGLNPSDAQPGWKQFTIAPRTGGGVSWARGRYVSIRGPIASAWRNEPGRFQLEVEIPANTTATVVLPVRTDAVITESGESLEHHPFVKRISDLGQAPSFNVAPGRYSFAATTAPP